MVYDNNIGYLSVKIYIHRRKNKMKTKRLLAFLLTVLMIGGMLPTVFAEDGAEAVLNPEFVFTNKAWGATGQYHQKPCF